MTELEAIGLLERARKELRAGYAYDIISDLILDATEPESPNPDKRLAKGHARLGGLEADALFRTLVLDHGWNVERAGPLYTAAMVIVERAS